jgi:succinyl-diaminopimelate desuccinylase
VTDLLALTADLVAMPSESRDEGPITDWFEVELRSVAGLDVTRVGDNVVARTDLGRATRLVLAGHTDTVPAHGNAEPRITGDTLWGLGSTDMKGGLAIMLDMARTVTAPVVDVTYVFYAREEIGAAESGLEEVFVARPDLMVGDVALLGEPTTAVIEAGCQGTMRLVVTLNGARAHTARAWMGRNAIHRLGEVLGRVADAEWRRPVIDGCEYREALQAVGIEGGVANNVVPDRATVTLNHRFAPDRTPDEAEAVVRAIVDPALEQGDLVERVDSAPAAAPGLDHPLLAALIERNGLEVRAKLGWTDVARFSSRGIPAANFGPGEATIAHTAEERLDREPLERTAVALRDLLMTGP